MHTPNIDNLITAHKRTKEVRMHSSLSMQSNEINDGFWTLLFLKIRPILGNQNVNNSVMQTQIINRWLKSVITKSSNVVIAMIG